MLRIVLSGGVYGKLFLLIGLLAGVPLIIIPFYPSESGYALSFLIPMLCSLAAGFIISVLSVRQKGKGLKREWQSPLQQGSLPVLFAWCLGFIIGAAPFVIGGQMNFIHALFESVSGWTTTGMTVADIPSMPRIFLFHRAFMQYCGGLGFILMMAVFVSGKQYMSLYNAEGHVDRLMPSLRKTSRVTSFLYLGFLAAGSVSYALFGMDFFDAVCHAMSALSTAGFSTQAGSIGHYGSFPIELVTVALMLIGASNFAVLLLLAERKIREMFRVTELRVMLCVVVLFVPLSAMPLAAEGMGIGESLRQALFGVVTIFSTTGYSTADYALWPPFVVGLLILLMIIGGCSGSTAGGIKMSRLYYLIRITRQSIRKKLSPARMVTVMTYNTSRGKMPIDEALISDTFAFLVCYIGVLISGSLALTLTAGCSLFDALFEFASVFGTVGVSNGLTNANTNTATLIVEIFGMILGRLEMFVVFIGIFSGIRTIEGKYQSIRQKP